ncbi:hypothetical protein ACIQXU_09815 [Peribacillus sp. NPDC097284]|uniref:hypothetical protein n=1 Tax=Peribacillus sp. NPDC097284 TaxID=3364401 RepID=UPI00381300FA
MQTRNDKTFSEKVIMDNCEYTNSIINNHIFTTKDREVTILNSKLLDTVVKVGNINSQGFSSTTILNKCEIVAITLTYIFATDFNQPSGVIKLNECNIEISNPKFNFLIFHEKIVNQVFTLILNDSNFNYKGTNPILKLAYYNNSKPMVKLISSENTFNNLTLPIPDTAIFVGFNPEIEFK